jgi:pheromone alpha factor receptor
MSTGASPTPSPDFNPFNQPFTLIGGDGVAFNATMGDVNHLGEYGIRLAINYGTQLSASVVLLLLLLLVIRREKQRSAIFTLNALCLSINFIRSLLQCLYLTGNYWNMYSQLAHDASRDSWKDKANTVASNTFTLLLVICIMISLSMQVWVVCKTASTIQRMVIMCTTSAMALVAIGYRFAVTVISNHLAMESQSMSSYVSLLDQMTIMQAVAIWLYCAIFTAKLGHALVQRRKLGLTQFGPMQIVLIMGLQCMIVPGMASSPQVLTITNSL